MCLTEATVGRALLESLVAVARGLLRERLPYSIASRTLLLIFWVAIGTAMRHLLGWCF